MSNCGTKIVDSCTDVTVMNSGNTVTTWEAASDKEIEMKFKRIASEVISVGQFLMTTTLAASSSSMSMNMVKGINALRCAFSSGFINVWMLGAALYFAARQFGQQVQLSDQVDEYYPYLCTCKKDVEDL